jgi:hypothetical protein
MLQQTEIHFYQKYLETRYCEKKDDEDMRETILEKYERPKGFCLGGQVA